MRGLPKEQRAFARNQHNLDVSRLLRKREGLRGLLHYLRNSMADRHKKKRVYNFLKKKKKGDDPNWEITYKCPEKTHSQKRFDRSQNL